MNANDNPRRALIAAMAGFALDGFDMLMLSFMLPSLSHDLALSPTDSGVLVTWTLVGGAIGGSGFGILADYIGRARVLSFSILVFSVFSILSAFSTGFYDLLFYRFCAGLGMGCEFGVGVVLATEAYPIAQRPRIASYVGLSWQIGVLLASLVTPLLLPVVGWRGAFVVGGLPALAAFFIRRGVRDSDEFRTARALRPAGENPVKGLWYPPVRRRSSVAICTMAFIQNFGYYGLMIWLPSYLTKERGFSMIHSGFAAALMVVGMIVGVLLFGRLSARIGYRLAFVSYQLGAAMIVLLYACVQSGQTLMLLGIVAGIFVNGMMGGYGELVGAYYPSENRSTAQSVLWSIGRACGGLAPLVIGYAAARLSFGGALAFLAFIYVVDLVVTVFVLPGRPGAAPAPRGTGAVSCEHG
ncbi:MFS transporter [Nguyenibacter vanlangensis]|uniref:MFS transporter n=1 Tax=Nguyenibacter vanlangensis TaxID=1216886 RepID=A0ABZ3DB93_9PROT